MTPSEQADDLYDKHRQWIQPASRPDTVKSYYTKKSCLITIRCILNALNKVEGQHQTLYDEEQFWIEVEKEILNK
jgi:hypothetical protein